MERPVVALVKGPVGPSAEQITRMVDQAVDHLGGMERFVKPGDYVTIKGNFFAPYPPPVIVDRRVVSALIRAVRRAGASRVVLCEAVSVGTKLGRGQSTSFVLDEMGIRQAAQEAGAEVLCLEDDQRVTVPVPDGKSIGMVEYPKCMHDCDVLIDLPCMKTHSMTLVTLGIKNFQGILNDGQKYYAHRDDLEQKLVDLFKIRKPDLTLIDGLIAMEGNGAGEYGIPRPGTSSGEGLLEVREERTIILDASSMNQLLNVDEENMMATAQCGYPLKALEEVVNKRGLTTGHSPQSQPLAQMGGLVATRSIGQFSTYYGAIEDMLCGLEAVMPDGRIIRIRNVPRRACGPDLRHLFLGSEGALAVITEVTVRLFPYYPDDMWMGGYIMKDMAAGFKAVRDIMAAGYKPSVVRLYDKPDIDYNFGSVTLKDEEAFMFFTAEGPAEVAKATGEGIHRMALAHGAQYIGTKAVEHWLEHRNDVCKLVGTEEIKRRYQE